jgi:hypothetical protein
MFGLFMNGKEHEAQAALSIPRQPLIMGYPLGDLSV